MTKRTTMRTRALAPALLLAALAVGCGGGDDGGDGGEAQDSSSSSPAPEESPSEPAEPSAPSEGGGEASSEFCTAFLAVGEVESFAQARPAFEDLVKVGVPEDAPADAGKGLDVFAGVVEKAETEKDLNRLGEKVPQKEQQQVAAFFRYGSETCLAGAVPNPG